MHKQPRKNWIEKALLKVTPQVQQVMQVVVGHIMKKLIRFWQTTVSTCIHDSLRMWWYEYEWTHITAFILFVSWNEILIFNSRNCHTTSRNRCSSQCCCSTSCNILIICLRHITRSWPVFAQEGESKSIIAGECSVYQHSPQRSCHICETNTNNWIRTWIIN